MKSLVTFSLNLSSMRVATVPAWQSAQKFWSWHCTHASEVECATRPCCRTKSPACENSATGLSGKRLRSVWHLLQRPSSKSTLCSWHLVQDFMVGDVGPGRVNS